MKNLSDFVGIPWVSNGRDYNGTDCVGMAYLYQRDVAGKDVTFPLSNHHPDVDTQNEPAILEWAEGRFTEIEEPEIGAIVSLFFDMNGRRYGHIGTIVDLHPTMMLHVLPDRRSCISKYRGRYALNTTHIFRVEEGD